jgi:hypothetical protein
MMAVDLGVKLYSKIYSKYCHKNEVFVGENDLRCLLVYFIYSQKLNFFKIERLIMKINEASLKEEAETGISYEGIRDQIKDVSLLLSQFSEDKFPLKDQLHPTLTDEEIDQIYFDHLPSKAEIERIADYISELNVIVNDWDSDA